LKVKGKQDLSRKPHKEKESVFYEKRRKTKPFTDDKENDKKNVSGNTDGHDHLHIPYRM